MVTIVHIVIGLSLNIHFLLHLSPTQHNLSNKPPKSAKWISLQQTEIEKYLRWLFQRQSNERSLLCSSRLLCGFSRAGLGNEVYKMKSNITTKYLSSPRLFVLTDSEGATVLTSRQVYQLKGPTLTLTAGLVNS